MSVDKVQQVERLRKMLDQAGVSRLRSYDDIDINDDASYTILRAVNGNDHATLKSLGFSEEQAWLDDVVKVVVEGASSVYVEPLRRIFKVATPTPAVRTGELLQALFAELAGAAENVKHFGLVDTGDVDVSSLVDRLDNCRLGNVKMTIDGDISFFPTAELVQKFPSLPTDHVLDLQRSGIVLQHRGVASSPAVNAQSLLDEWQPDSVHLVLLDQMFDIQQFRTYALLRALDVAYEHSYHNVFFDSRRLSPELTVFIVARRIEQELERLLRTLTEFKSWEQFDPEDYVAHNYGERYGERIAHEDEQLICFLAEQLAHDPPEGAMLAVDVGCGPNLYPGMLISPYLQGGGRVDLMDLSEPNREYLIRATQDEPTKRLQSEVWRKFERRLTELCGALYVDAFDDLCERTSVVDGSIFSLPANTYDIVASFYVAESITNSRREFRLAIRAMAQSLKPGGVLLLGHMVGSQGYRTGNEQEYPVVSLLKEDLEQAYRDADLSFSIHTVADEDEKVLSGYPGMAAAIARRIT